MIKEKRREGCSYEFTGRMQKEAMKITVPITDVELPSVFHEMLDGTTGYIRISEFKGVTCQQYQKAFSELKGLRNGEVGGGFREIIREGF